MLSGSICSRYYKYILIAERSWGAIKSSEGRVASKAFVPRSPLVLLFLEQPDNSHERWKYWKIVCWNVYSTNRSIIRSNKRFFWNCIVKNSGIIGYQHGQDSGSNYSMLSRLTLAKLVARKRGKQIYRYSFAVIRRDLPLLIPSESGQLIGRSVPVIVQKTN